MKRSSVYLIAQCCLLVFALCNSASGLLADLPTGEAIFQKSIEKNGGSEAFAKIKTTVMIGKLNMPEQNVSGDLAIYSEGEKNYTSIKLPGIGTVEDGYNGEIAWEVSAIQGARIKEGAEKTALKNASSVSMMRNWKDNFKELKTVAVENVEGKPAYKVEATPKEGKTMTMYFDQDSYLMVKMSVIMPSPMGEIPTDTLITDYKMVQGVMTPFTMTQKIMTASIITNFTSIEYNTELPKDRFELPQPIKALLEKRKTNP